MSSRPVIKSSPWLYKFYVDYRAWLSAGADTAKFSREFGLCSNLKFYFERETAEFLLTEMQAAFIASGVDGILPFNKDKINYASESINYACHLNPARIAWVQARIEDGMNE